MTSQDRQRTGRVPRWVIAGIFLTGYLGSMGVTDDTSGCGGTVEDTEIGTHTSAIKSSRLSEAEKEARRAVRKAARAERRAKRLARRCERLDGRIARLQAKCAGKPHLRRCRKIERLSKKFAAMCPDPNILQEDFDDGATEPEAFAWDLSGGASSPDPSVAPPATIQTSTEHAYTGDTSLKLQTSGDVTAQNDALGTQFCAPTFSTTGITVSFAMRFENFANFAGFAVTGDEHLEMPMVWWWIDQNGSIYPDSSGLGFTAGTWHQVNITIAGGQFTVMIDGQPHTGSVSSMWPADSYEFQCLRIVVGENAQTLFVDDVTITPAL